MARIKFFLEKLVKNKVVLTIFGTIVIVALAIFIGYNLSKPKVQKEQVRIQTPTTSTNSSGVYTPPATDISSWEIVDTSASPLPFPTGMKFHRATYASGDEVEVLKWSNYLISYTRDYYTSGTVGNGYLGDRPSSELQSQIRSVRVYNIDTGETYDIPLDKPTWGEIWSTASQILDNKYYFGVGGSFGPSLGYELSLPPTRGSRVIKLKTGLGNEIKKYGSFYVSSFCYEGCSYSLYDSSTETTSELTRLEKAGGAPDPTRKEQLIGIDNLGRVIVLDNNTKQINEFPLNDESVTIPLVTSPNMPQGNFQYLLSKDTNKILLYGDKTFVYDITNNEFQEIKVSSDVQKYKESLGENAYFYPTLNSSDPNVVCFAGGNVNGALNFTIDMKAGSYVYGAVDTCTGKSNSVEDEFKKLGLDKKFVLSKTQVSVSPN